MADDTTATPESEVELAPPAQKVLDRASRSLPPPWLQRTGLGAAAIIAIAVVVIGIVYATAKISTVFIAIFVALVLTSVLNPVVNWLDKHMPRGLAVGISLLGAIAVLVGLLAFVTESVVGHWAILRKQFGEGLGKIADTLNSLPFGLELTSNDVTKYITDAISKGESYIAENWQDLAGQVVSNAGSIMVFFTVSFLVLFLTIFFLLQGGQMWRWFLNMLPTKHRANWNTGAQAGWWSFAGYARGTGMIALIDGVLAWIFLEILRVPLAPALGVLVMIGALIPMIGAPLAMVVAAVVALATDGIWTAVIVAVGIALIGQFEGHILQPLIMGKQVSLSPVVVALGVITGTLLAGLLGAIIAIPIIGVTWAVFNSLYHRDPPIEGPLPGHLPKEEIETEKLREERSKQGFFARLFGKKPKEESSDKGEAAKETAAAGSGAETA